MGNDIGIRVRAAREAAGLTIEKLAFTAGLSVATIARVEKGANLPETKTLKAIGLALGVPWSQLADDAPDDDGEPLARATG